MKIYVHAGNSVTVRTRDIIGIFDMDTATMTSSTRDYLRIAEREGRMVNIKDDIPKAFIIARHSSGNSGVDTVYVSQISTSALIGRT